MSPKQSVKKQPDNMAMPQQPLPAKSYAVISLVGFLLALGFTFFYVYQVPKLVESGVENKLFYVLLILWAASAAAFLFGAMKAYAQWTYKKLGNVLELGGPVVLFCLVMIGGFKLVPQAPTFDLAVRAQSNDTPLVTSGQVKLDLPGLPQANIGPDGEANFKGVSAQYKGKAIRVLPQVDGYDKEWLAPAVDGNTLILTLRKEHPVTQLIGTVVPPPAKGKHLRVLVEGQDGEAEPDELGRFKLAVNGKIDDRVRLKVYDGTRLVYDDFQVLPGPVSLQLHKPR